MRVLDPMVAMHMDFKGARRAGRCLTGCVPELPHCWQFDPSERERIRQISLLLTALDLKGRTLRKIGRLENRQRRLVLLEQRLLQHFTPEDFRDFGAAGQHDDADEAGLIEDSMLQGLDLVRHLFNQSTRRILKAVEKLFLPIVESALRLGKLGRCIELLHHTRYLEGSGPVMASCSSYSKTQHARERGFKALQLLRHLQQTIKEAQEQSLEAMSSAELMVSKGPPTRTTVAQDDLFTAHGCAVCPSSCYRANLSRSANTLTANGQRPAAASAQDIIATVQTQLEAIEEDPHDGFFRLSLCPLDMHEEWTSSLQSVHDELQTIPGQPAQNLVDQLQETLKLTQSYDDRLSATVSEEITAVGVIRSTMSVEESMPCDDRWSVIADRCQARVDQPKVWDSFTCIHNIPARASLDQRFQDTCCKLDQQRIQILIWKLEIAKSLNAIRVLGAELAAQLAESEQHEAAALILQKTCCIYEESCPPPGWYYEFTRRNFLHFKVRYGPQQEGDLVLLKGELTRTEIDRVVRERKLDDVPVGGRFPYNNLGTEMYNKELFGAYRDYMQEVARDAFDYLNAEGLC